MWNEKSTEISGITAYINVKKQLFIHNVQDDGSKTAKIIKI